MAPPLDGQIASTASNYGVSPALLSRVIGIESGGNPNAVSSTGVQGIAQITQDTWKTWNPGIPYSTDPQAQLNTAAQILSSYNTTYNGNQALVGVAYNGGPGVANYAQNLMNQGVDQNTAIAQAAAHYYPNNIAKQQEVSNYAAKMTGGSTTALATTATGQPASQVLNTTQYTGGVDDTNVPMVENITGDTIDNQNVLTLVTSTSFSTTSGLNVAPWYNDPNLVYNNSRLKQKLIPIQFTIALPDGSVLGPTATQATVLRLNASLKSHEISQSHNMVQTPTRTGLMITMWGQEPDLVTGSGTTGAFINQVGLTQLMSTSILSTNLKNAISNALISVPTNGHNNSTGNISSGIALNALANQTSALRVAAEDAFMELLMLFKNNGVVYYPQVSPASINQGEPAAWSSSSGMNSYQIASSNGDVRAKGYVNFIFGNDIYFGYFKSLSWRISADKPFEWDFDFVFKVQQSYTQDYVPVSSSNTSITNSTGAGQQLVTQNPTSTSLITE